MNRFPIVGKADDVDEPGGCHWALCTRPAEFRVSLPRHEPMLVCALHVSPVLTWGWTDEDDDFPVVETLAS